MKISVLKKKIMFAVAGCGIGLATTATAGGDNYCEDVCAQATIECAQGTALCQPLAEACFMCGPLR